ncbi:MAG: DoxX family protein [Chlorobi bacterium]|nr:DoxX family protein [Chlorobiota bacterium]
MKTLANVARFITGLVFTFSGFVKAVDPVGTQIKFSDYFEAMGLAFLMPYALVFSFVLNAAELTIGLMLVFNVLPKLANIVGLLLLFVFTPLTLWLAVENPVTDCGCFGDAVKLTNWQTFGKNVILLLLMLFLYIYERKQSYGISGKKAKILLAVFIILSLVFEKYNYCNLPVIDFRPFKEGTDIKQAVTVPPDAPKDVYETILYYKNKKNGERKAFDINNIPYKDTAVWEYDTTITKLISKGYEPPVHDFYLSNLAGQDITDKILNFDRLTLILIMPRLKEGLEKTDKEKIRALAEYAEKNHYPFYCFTSSVSDEIERQRFKLPRNVEILTGDYKMLKTFIRSNPGFVLMKNAVILKKYHYKNIPDPEEIESINIKTLKK